MAFKMKGDPYKMGKIATKSALKMAKEKQSAMDMNKKSPMELKTSYKMKEAMAKMKENSAMKQAKPDYPDIDGDGNTTESMKQAAADKKSPIKDTRYFGQNTSHDEAKAVTNHNKRHRNGWPADHKRKKQADKSPAKHRVTKEQFPNNYNAHNSAHDKGKFKSATDHSPAKHRVGKKAHDSAHDGTHPTADTFINDKHETKEGLARKEKMAKKSPMEQGTKFTDKLKAFGTAMTSEDGLMTSGLGAVHQAKSRYDREKKKYRKAAADKKKGSK